MDSLYRYADLETRLRATGHALGVIVLAFVVGALGLQILAIPVLGLFVDITVDNQLTPVASIVLSIVQFVGFMGVAIAYVRWRDVTLFGAAFPSLKDIGWIVGGLFALFGSVIVLGYIIQFLGIESAENTVVEMGRQNPDFFLYMVPVALLFIGPGEELLFRGVVQGLLRQAYGVVPAVLATSALFGVAHYLALSGGGKLTYIAIAGALGIVLGAAYELSGNIVVPSVIHGIYNAILFFGNWVIETQDIPQQAATFLPW
jgi:membrane protease YdiL (CAAX protease family)